jgi:sugar phosphate isomerase/epimerase
MNDVDATPPLNRRAFVRVLAGAGLGGVALGACSPRVGATAAGAALAAGSHADRIGLQLYTVRDLLQQDFEGTIAEVARIGYREVEFAGYYQRAPEQIRALLDQHGLTAPSTHVGANALRQDFEGQVRTARAIGHTYLTVPAYRVPQGDDPVGGWRTAATEFNTFGRRCRDEGLRFAYHNHAWEFESLPGGTTPFDILVAETDPELVDFELDLYWAHHGGRDPIRLFEQYPGRFTMWHVKDMRDPQGSKEMVPVGEGAIDFGEIFARASRSGMRHFFVEHDNAGETVGSLNSIRTSFQHLRGLLA